MSSNSARQAPGLYGTPTSNHCVIITPTDTAKIALALLKEALMRTVTGSRIRTASHQAYHTLNPWMKTQLAPVSAHLNFVGRDLSSSLHCSAVFVQDMTYSRAVLV